MEGQEQTPPPDPKEPNQAKPDISEFMTPAEKALGGVLVEARKAMTTLADYAIANGADENKLAHLESIWDGDGFAVIKGKHMPPGMKAGTSPATGEVWISDEHVDLGTVYHESIHRAAHLGRQASNTPTFKTQISEPYRFINRGNGVIEAAEGNPLREYPEPDRSEVLKWWNEKINEDRAKLEEGLTEWALIKTVGLTGKDGAVVNIEGKRLYAPQVAAVEAIKVKMQEQQRLSPSQADAILIQAAVTGDWSTTIFNKINRDDLSNILLIDTPEAYPGGSLGKHT